MFLSEPHVEQIHRRYHHKWISQEQQRIDRSEVIRIQGSFFQNEMRRRGGDRDHNGLGGTESCAASRIT